MPVSAFSSGSVAVRSESRNEHNMRWNSARDTLSGDERRVSENEVSEMDATPLYERSDWPLSNKTASDPTVAPQSTNWRETDHHIARVVDTNWLDTEDVSDVEEEDNGSVQQVGGAEAGHTEHENRRASRPLSRRGRPVSFAAELVDVSNTNSRRSSPRVSERSFDDAEDIKPEQGDGRVSPVISPAHSTNDDVRSVSSSGSGHDQTRTTENSSPSPKQLTSISKRASSLLDGLSEEQLDSTPPLPSEAFRQSPDIPRSSTVSPSSRRPSDTAATRGHARHSSAAKAFQGYHSRQSSFNTTHVPSNRDRVRYSWQSVHEDDSGKPRIHIIKLVSNNTSASSAFPQGEAFGFSISPSGRRIAAYNSARLFILQTAALPVGISQDFALKRRPLAVELNDSGSLVAILADQHTVNVYDLSLSKLRRIKTLKLDFSTHCIAIAPSGGLLAVAYDSGIEVFSLAASALPTDRRAVRSQRMDRLEFSEDGSTLLGTTTRLHASSTVVINVPVFPAAPSGVPTPEELKVAWCSELLHPENIRNSSHAAFMREDRAVQNEHVFAWNGLADTFGILSTTDLEYGPIDFPLVVSPPLSTCGGLGAAIHSCPVVDEFGDCVAMIVNDRTIRLYMVPQVDDEPETSIEAHSIDHELDDGYGCPFGEVRWVHSSAALPTPIRSHAQPRGRLLVTSPGGVYSQEQIEESFDEIEGGRIIIFDFDPQFTGQPGQTVVLNLGKSPPQPLQEDEDDLADAVALVRRRTVKQNTASDMRPLSLGRAATTLTTNTRNHSRPGSTAMYSRRTASILSVGSNHTESSRSLPDLVEGVENGEILEEPFSNQAPRSQASLQRAASNVQRHRFQSLEERNQQSTGGDGTGFMPLPEYTEEPNAPLPSRFRAMAGLDAPAASRMSNTAYAEGLEMSHNVPMSAPAGIAEAFSAEQAFATANASMHSQRGVTMPRSLLRAYSNATSMMRRESHPAARSGTSDSNSVSLTSIEEQFQNPSTYCARSEDHIISPISAPSNSMIARAYDNRFSTPLSAISDYQANMPRRSSSTRRPGENIYGTSRNYNMSAYRQAAATASLFPPTQSSDELPLPANRLHSTGAVAHPITSWRPPAPSAAPQPQSPGQASRGHSRKSSLASKTAFANTAKARKLGFFKKRSPGRRSSVMQGQTDDATVDDSKSMMTWTTGSDKKCAMM